jgi:ParB family chromosome partitioning protein
MMMDLGATVAGIAEKTGFGETTIRRRLAIAQLPSREVEKAVKKGATLMDFARLDKLQDPNHRAEALEYLGSHNFDFKLNDLIKQEEFIRNAPRVTDIIEAAGLHPLPEDTEYWEYRNSEIVYINDDLSAEDIPEWAEYFYWEEKSAWFRVTGADLRKQNNTPAAMHSEDEAARRKDCDERTEKLGQIMSQMHELRWNAVKDVAGVSELKLEEWAVKAFLDYGEVDIDYLNRISGISEDEYVEVEVNEGYGSIIQHDKYHSLFVEKIPSVKKRLLYAVYLIYEPGDNENRFLDKFATTVSLSKNGQQDLVQVYNFLRDVIGYQMSDVERSITYGSHELYDPQIRTDEPAGEEGSEDAA